jgi:Pyridoxamine-phosphate oxidase
MVFSAMEADIIEPSAMSLATAVMKLVFEQYCLKYFDDRGFVFFY